MSRILLPVLPNRRYHPTLGDPLTRAAFTLALFILPTVLSAQTPRPHPPPNLELRLLPGKLVDGFPTSFTFVFTNIAHHNVRMPKPSNCDDITTGTVTLMVKEAPPPRSDTGGACANSYDPPSPLCELAKRWPVLEPGHSLRVSYSLQHLFFYDRAPARYEFWAEYFPPFFNSHSQRNPCAEGIDFPRSRLTSPHLIFVKKR